MGTTLYFLKLILRIETDNWRAEREINRMNREIAAGWVGDDELIKSDKVIAVSKVPTIPEFDSQPQAQRSSPGVLTVIVIIAVLLLLVVIAYAWGLFGQ